MCREITSKTGFTIIIKIQTRSVNFASVLLLTNRYELIEYRHELQTKHVLLDRGYYQYHQKLQLHLFLCQMFYVRYSSHEF